MAKNHALAVVKAYKSQLTLIWSCITEEQLIAAPAKNREFIGTKTPVRLKRTNGAPLFLEVGQYITVVKDKEAEEGCRVTTLEYIYTIYDHEQKELIDFHFHPSQRVKVPHIHLYADNDPRFKSFYLHKKHIPSGRVAIEDVLEFLIDELGVEAHRNDWREQLAKTKAEFDKNRKW